MTDGAAPAGNVRGGRTETSAGTLILASASPRRAEILTALGVTFSVCVPDVDETCDAARPEWSVRTNAAEKARWAARRHPDACILAADTMIVFRGDCVGKPADMDEARRMLLAFSGHEHRVLTGMAFLRPGGDIEVALDAATVRFKLLSPGIVDAYLSRVDPLDKAGGYNIAESADPIIECCDGSRSTIMGLSVAVISGWLTTAGQE